MKNLKISTKFLVVFGVIIAFTGALGIGSFISIDKLGRVGEEVGAELAPLGDAAMEIKLTATHAHLLFEEIMSGDPGEDINEVWALLDETAFYTNAIMNGGSNDEGTFVASRAQNVQDTMKQVEASLADFVEAARTRYASLADNQGVGSEADEEFDTLYDELVSRIDELARPAQANADVQRLSGDARYLLAHGHLLVAEILGGDEGEDFGEATGSFEAAKARLNDLPSSEIDPDARNGVVTDIDRLISLANQRYETKSNMAGAGSNADEIFDKSFDDFIALADQAEEAIHDDMDAGLSLLRNLRVRVNTVQAIGSVLVILVCTGAWFFFRGHIAGRASDLAQSARRLASGDVEADLPVSSSRDELGELNQALAGFRSSLLEQKELADKIADKDQQQAAERTKFMQDLSRDFRSTTAAYFEALESASQGLSRAVSDMTQAADSSNEMVGATVETVDSASNNVETVAAAAEELSASIGEINRQVSTTAQVVGNASAQARTTSDKITSLADAVGRIGEVVTLIQEIAEQTNLLALNATIEAARAGEMGKGFAVVAAEVKELATQTATATDEIGGHINAIQSETQDAVAAMEAILGTMGEIDTNTAAISSAVSEQGSATSEIASNAQVTTGQTSQVSSNMEQMAQAVATVAQSSTQVRQSSQEVSEQSMNLRQAMDDFLERLAS